MSIIAIVVFALAAYIAVGAIIAKKRNMPYDYFGYSLHVVTTASMSPDYAVQDMVFIKKTPIDSVALGDDVLYKSTDQQLGGGNVLHRVVAIEIVDGKTILTTAGTSGGGVDPIKVEEIIGVAKGNNQALGKIYLMLTTPSGWIAMGMLLCGIFLVTKCLSNIVKSCKKSNADGEANDITDT